VLIAGLAMLLERLNLIAKLPEISNTEITALDPPVVERPAIVERGPAPNPLSERALQQQRARQPRPRKVRSVPSIRPIAWWAEPSIIPDFALEGGIIHLKGKEGSAIATWRVPKETKK